MQKNSDQEDELLKAYSALLGKEVWSESSVLKPDGKRLKPVTEAVFYPEDFATVLKEQFQGCTVTDVAEFLEIAPEHVIQMLNGLWRPTKDICKRMGLTTVYTIPARQGTASKPRRRSANS